MRIEGNELEKKGHGGISRRKPGRGPQAPGRICSPIPQRIRGQRPLPLPKGLPLSRKLQRMRSNSSGSRRTCPKLYAAAYQQKIRLLSELTEHTIAREIEPPREILRKTEK